MLVDLVCSQYFAPFLQLHHLLQIYKNILKKKKDCICLNLFHFSKDIRATTLNSFGDY